MSLDEVNNKHYLKTAIPEIKKEKRKCHLCYPQKGHLTYTLTSGNDLKEMLITQIINQVFHIFTF